MHENADTIGVKKTRLTKKLEPGSDLIRTGRALNDMKIALVGLQLRRRHVLNGDGVVGGVGNHGVAVTVVTGCRQ